MDENSSLTLPPELQARLDVAGVHDDETLNAALERDPELRAAFLQFLDEHRDELENAQMAALLTAFAQTQNDAQMVEFWNQVPRELEQPFLDAAQNVIAQAEAGGQAENVAGLKQRLDALTRIVEQQRAFANLSPVERAVTAFLFAPDEATARKVFEQERARLQPYEAQQMLEGLADADEPQIRERVQERLALLRELRGVAPKPLTPSPSPVGRGEYDAALPPSPVGRGVGGEGNIVDISGTANVAGSIIGGDKIIQGNEIVTNINHDHFEFAWNPPSPPYLEQMVRREFEVGEVLRRLEQYDTVAIGGRTDSIGGHAVAVQGMAGIGKTTLVKILAHIVHQKPTFPQFADGILWTDVGPEKKTREQAQSILNEWAGYVIRGRIEGMSFTPNAVRQLLEQHPQLLVVLDNVWSLDVVRPLRDALPLRARLVVTTRSLEVMNGLGGNVYELGKLSDADAHALVKLRLGWEPANDADAKWLAQLFNALDFHALALDVALGLLKRQPAQTLWRATAEKIIHSVQHGTEFDKLVMPADEREKNVERSLWFSYAALGEIAQTR